jgi:NodT family efflux transporter outer membrane factor (OMF) lipoprotein
MKPSRRPVSRPRVRLWFTAASALFVTVGCAMVGPDYTPPAISAPAKWHTPPGQGVASGEKEPTDIAEWWSSLSDEVLSTLIRRAVAGNFDLGKAQARVREARAQRRIASAGLFPSLNASASASFSRSSGDSRSQSSSDSQSSTQPGSPLSSGFATTPELYNAGLDASWELDVFGRTRRSVEAADRALQADVEDQRNVLVTLLAEVATNYVEVRAFQTRLDVAEANLEIQQETFMVAQWRHEAGLGDELAVYQARYSLETTRSLIPALRQGMNESMNRIAVLLGEQPGRVHGDLKSPAPVPVVPSKVVVGIPADALRRRPDVRRAERQLAAQTSRVGVATADLYPKFTLSGSVGLEAFSFDGLFSSAIRTVTDGIRISWPVFQGGALRHKIEVQSALQEQAFWQYEATVLGALEEVENALKAYAEEQNKRDSLREGEKAARLAAETAEKKYEAGLTDFISVLEAQRSRRTFQEQVAQSEGNVAVNLVRLYKALGGGWEKLSGRMQATGAGDKR